LVFRSQDNSERGDWFHKQKPRLGPIRIAQCLNLEREFHHTVSKLCILGFEPLK
jgi:hypothetical protein